MARLFLAAMVGLACLTSGAFGQFMQQQPMAQPMQFQQPMMQQQPMQQPMMQQQPMQQQPMQPMQQQQQQQFVSQSGTMQPRIDFPEEIAKDIRAHSVPDEAYTWTDQQVTQHLKEVREAQCAPVLRACKGQKKCKCHLPFDAAGFMNTVTRMREYAERVQAQMSFQQQQQTASQLQMVESQEHDVESKLSSEQKTAEGYQLLSAALAVCLMISVAFNYYNVKGMSSGNNNNMRSEVKAAIASMTRA